MMEGVRWLAEIDETTELPRGSRFDDFEKADAFPLVRHPVLAQFAAEAAEQGRIMAISIISLWAFGLLVAGDLTRQCGN